MPKSSCQDYFLRLLSRREYTAWELRRKAQDKGYESQEITEAIDYLQSKDYQSDKRFIEDLISSSQGKYGKPVIMNKCLQKGISRDLFAEVWSETAEDLPDNQLEDLKAKAMRKYKITDFNDLDPKTKNKLCNFLSYRGFNPFELIQQWSSDSF
ncbi:regulatory protein RecX [Oscillatoria salina]|uniref:regulatory protein RecX n=1 Tax=Oscillatoria salina TaxID=331517 RepID=UPI0013B88B3F|nr:regulatory protein RecX [Oscillatoria salina]MBZ8180994.1 regulatory protein RecX [Oscillatoria salina IIICB1]NET88115.1 regulatory protein RecX [Kamptonema sp. SIO1D9]